MKIWQEFQQQAGKDIEPIEVHMSKLAIEPASQLGLMGRINGRISPIVLDKDQKERMREQLELLRDSDLAACGLTAEDIKEACSRVTVLARGHCIRNADATVTDVSNDPNYECK